MGKTLVDFSFLMDLSPRWLHFYKADVFTDRPFGGNPVAVFPNSEDLTNQEFQQNCPGNESVRNRIRDVSF